LLKKSLEPVILNEALSLMRWSKAQNRLLPDATEGRSNSSGWQKVSAIGMTNSVIFQRPPEYSSALGRLKGTWINS
jgi:hypothetical protein